MVVWRKQHSILRKVAMTIGNENTKGRIQALTLRDICHPHTKWCSGRISGFILLFVILSLFSDSTKLKT